MTIRTFEALAANKKLITTNNTIVNYDFWEVAPIETLDYMTWYCPELLDKLSYPIFSVLKGGAVEEAIAYINNNMLE